MFNLIKKTLRKDRFHSVFAMICFAVIVTVTPAAKANFEIVMPKKSAEVLPHADVTFMPFSQKQSGVGNNAKLEDVIELLIKPPYTTVFISQELRALKVDWMSNGRSIAEILSMMGRNYGFEPFYVESTGKVFIEWANGMCDSAVSRELEQRRKIQEKVGFSSGGVVTPKVLRVVDNERTYLC